MIEQSAVFAWYELLTTDVPAAQFFYGKVVGWDVQDASTSEFAYRLFSVGGTPRGTNGAAARRAEEGGDAAMGGLCRGRGCGRGRRSAQASWRHGVRATDGQQHRPACGGRRSANRDARPDQGIEIWRSRYRARRAWPRLLARTIRRRRKK